MFPGSVLPHSGTINFPHHLSGSKFDFEPVSSGKFLKLVFPSDAIAKLKRYQNSNKPHTRPSCDLSSKMDLALD